ncbi:hypothetical protein [Massilia sp. DWR3-1-1]|uniref:hypothetical protein n=1 Tax=Massilia sp. DWR3-1-1 TaxID=2804559 RepID=UPI003CF0AF6B
MKTPYTNRWIALDALGPEDDDAELRDYVSADLDEPDGLDELAKLRQRALAQAAPLARHHGVGPGEDAL